MKGIHFLINGILTISLVSVPQAAFAGEISAASSNSARHDIKPFNLVHRAYSGDFSDQGVPGFNRFITAYESGQIGAQDLVQTAVDQGRLPQDALNDESYLEAVELHLQSLEPVPGRDH
jgi:hypothetical protein